MEQVENTIKAQEQDVVRSDVLYVLVLGDHVQLWEDGQGLKPDRKGPEYAVKGELRVHDEAQHDGQEVQPVVGKRIRLVIVTLHYTKNYQLKRALKPNDPNRVRRNKDEKYSHDVEVHRPPVILKNHVRVPRHEHNQVQLLGFV